MESKFNTTLRRLKDQTFGHNKIKAKRPGIERLVSTYRPIEIMFIATGMNPEDLRGRDIINIGAGKTHWGLELTTKFGVIAHRFENVDIAYIEQPMPKRLIGKAFMAESIADIKNELPFKDNSFDILWCSYAPTNFKEFLRVIRPGGEIFILGGDYDNEKARYIEQSIGVPVIYQEISEDEIKKWTDRTKTKKDRYSISLLKGRNLLIIRKPKKTTNNPSPQN